MSENVDFTDIYVDDAIVERVTDVLESTWYVKGEHLDEFERQFAEECGTDHAVGVSSGTAAILLGLQAAGIGNGDQVMVPGHTYFASASPVLTRDAEPVFVDIDPETYTIDPADLREKVERAANPQAVIPVHIYGQLADMDAVLDIADEHDLLVLEDACQAHFAHRGDHVAGAAGDIGTFSFYPSKNMTVGGDGGMLVTDDDEIARTARALRNHGRNDAGEHVELGLNYRLDEMNAVVGQEQLKHIRDWNEQRNAAAQKYTKRLSEIPAVTTPTEADDAFHVYHLYVVRVPNREVLRSHLDEHNIDTGLHYETPAHQHEAIVSRVGETTLRVTEEYAPDILSLPMHPRITDEEIETVCEAIEVFYE